mmetsp:Transcript_98384/g.261404  ORF Transcript_98384/g.261404 Transcript_98384/m.261404 type:complete len:256 (-) Transcript_98384:138-905(-)|eukprot:CAMPEP_0171190042 /NCGR_PEP_ID=MMETSP0790-20130122/18655_1 /TAXON_ID=2925 /ORGANISM="Alexandrium catenella, Strain OF101" /LENGTH=255 /DNA_ID=CAMNT_0011655167 /DNA_START=81 /DNA_END=848 /DNA_ORIENTATION=-
MWLGSVARRRVVSQVFVQAARPSLPSSTSGPSTSRVLPGRVRLGTSGSSSPLAQDLLQPLRGPFSSHSCRCLASWTAAQRCPSAGQPVPLVAARALSSSSGGGAGAGEPSPAAGSGPKAEPAPSLEERVQKLEAALEAQQAKLVAVEKMAKKRGIMAMFMEYGAPLAVWYCTAWASTFFLLYMLLEWEIVSWQDSLRPLFEGLGLGAYVDRLDPTVGNVVIAFTVNELLEPLRLPFVIATGKPMIELFKRLRKRV